MKTRFTILILLLVSNLNAQFRKENLSFHFGVQRSDHFDKPFHAMLFYEGHDIYSQHPIVLFNFNVQYEKQLKNNKSSILFGSGIGRMGFIENGFAYQIRPDGHKYTTKYVKPIVPLFIGYKYKIATYKKFEFSISQLLMTEFLGYSKESSSRHDLFKIFGFSTRTNFPISYPLKHKRQLFITPYFQTAISKYNKDKLTPSSSNYWPYSYGINIGCSLKERKRS